MDEDSFRGHRKVEKDLQTTEGMHNSRNFPFGKPLEILDVMACRWHFGEIEQQLKIPMFIPSRYAELTTGTALTISLFLIDFNFEKPEFEKQLLNVKTILVQEQTPEVVLFPASVIQINYFSIFMWGWN